MSSSLITGNGITSNSLPHKSDNKNCSKYNPPSSRVFTFWQHESYPVLLVSDLLFSQKLNYLHWNPVTAGFVNEPWDWNYSSAIDCMTKYKGALDLIFLE